MRNLKNFQTKHVVWTTVIVLTVVILSKHYIINGNKNTSDTHRSASCENQTVESYFVYHKYTQLYKYCYKEYGIQINEFKTKAELERVFHKSKFLKSVQDFCNESCQNGCTDEQIGESVKYGVESIKETASPSDCHNFA